MRRFLFLVPFGFLLFFFACDTNDSENNDVQIQDVQIDIGDPKSLKMSQLFDTCFIVPLDNRELVGVVSEVDFDEEQLLVLDKKKMLKAYLYNWQGEFIKFLANGGEGPGEFKWPSDAQLIDEKEVVIYSAGTHKLLFVDQNTDKTKDVFLDSITSLFDFKFFDRKFYFLRANAYGKNESLLVSDVGFQDFKEILIPEKFLSRDKAYHYRSTKYSFIYPKSSGNGFYFSDVVSPYFLEYGGDTLQKAYHVRFSGRELDYSDIDNGTDRSFYNIASRDNLFYFGNALFEGGDLLFLPVIEGIAVRTAIYNKETGRSIYVNEIDDDLTGFPSGNAFAGEESSKPEFYVRIIPAAVVDEVLKNSQGMANSYLDFLREKDIKRDDNPVLFIYRFKEEIDLD
ncbi:6-bladed beta-propeller [Algoriphagus yeomjeoni]|uniref:6-bladed beta-propeller n=1 Tax=Algoriphagus yeomjeoni TaxID=291403 RepID=UPI003CE4B40E